MTTLNFPIPRPAASVQKHTNVITISDEELNRLGVNTSAKKAVYRSIAADSLKHESTIIRYTGLDEVTVCKALADLMHSGLVRRAVAPLGGLLGPFETIRK